MWVAAGIVDRQRYCVCHNLAPLDELNIRFTTLGVNKGSICVAAYEAAVTLSTAVGSAVASPVSGKADACSEVRRASPDEKKGPAPNLLVI